MTFGFDPAADAVPPAKLLPLDAHFLRRAKALARRIRDAYERYEFQTVFFALNTLMTVDLSAFYLDVSKDVLYTYATEYSCVSEPKKLTVGGKALIQLRCQFSCRR